MRSRFRYVLMGVLSAGLALAASAQAQTKWSYPGCSDVTDADFEYTTLMQAGKAPDPTLSEPDKLAFDMDAQGNVDIYFTEIRPGKIKRYSAKTKTVKTLVKLPNWGLGSDYQVVANGKNVEEGVTGIALDPNFKTNGYVYVHWSPLPDSLRVFRISRFTVTGDTILLSSQKILLDIPGQRATCCHTGGAMQFDAYGDLWITMGDNSGRANGDNPTQGIDEVKKYESQEWGASSTKGLRGGILRIHPDNSEKGYSIPKDNFGEYFARTLGKPEYLDTSLVSPEIFIKGTRNAYSLAIDPVRRWVAWGDVGPDRLEGKVREEINFRKTPGYEGWPYFVGNNTPFSSTKNASAPTNTSIWNKGLSTLPSARPAFRLHNIGNSPIVGPYYLYDGDLQSSTKLPPHFNRKIFVTDYASKRVQVVTLDADATKSDTAQFIFGNKLFNGPVDFRQGPDGALYISVYGPINFATDPSTAIIKISYNGTCRPATPKLEPVGIGQSRHDLSPLPKGVLINLSPGKTLTVPVGMQGLELFSISGFRVWASGKVNAGSSLRLPDNLQFGILKYRWIQVAE